MTTPATPRTAIERLLDLLPGSLGDDREIQAAAEAIEAEALSIGHKEGYLSRAEDERFKADFPEAGE